MPYRPTDDAAWRAVRQQIHELLEPFAEAFGPRECAHGNYAECEEDCMFGDTQPKAGSMPTVKDWVLVLVSEDVVNDDPHIEVVQSPGLRMHNLNGLLHTALYE